jgi:DNA invertase Pin-like site-specific DNA recombinase
MDFLHNPFGDTPQGKLLTQRQGMRAEYERAQIHERTRRGRLEKAHHGEFIPGCIDVTALAICRNAMAIRLK